MCTDICVRGVYDKLRYMYIHIAYRSVAKHCYRTNAFRLRQQASQQTLWLVSMRGPTSSKHSCPWGKHYNTSYATRPYGGISGFLLGDQLRVPRVLAPPGMRGDYYAM